MEAWLKDFFESQLLEWDLASKNVEALKKVKRKPFKIGDLYGYVQFNPARAVSTLANVEKQAIDSRPCFLCQLNRPEKQQSLEILPGWDLLVNPFPILPYHFTIVNRIHTRQKLLIETGKKLAEKLPGMVVFFNDEGAGASAPDHIHFQAVPLEELPLINILSDERNDISLPYKIIKDIEVPLYSDYPVNAYFWKTSENVIRNIIIPRKTHRPKEFYLDMPHRRAVSPGAIDMAGVIVTPIEVDFNSINLWDIKNIYSQVAFGNE